METYMKNNLWPIISKPTNHYENAHHVDNCQKFVESAEIYFEPLKIQNFEFSNESDLKLRLSKYYSELELLNNFRAKMDVIYVIKGGHQSNAKGLKLIDRLIYVRDGVLRDVEFLKNRFLNLEIKGYTKKQMWASIIGVFVAITGIIIAIISLRISLSS